MLTMIASLSAFGQCNQHVFTTVGATNSVDFEFVNCDGLSQAFTLPYEGYTTILCADLGTAFVVGGNGFVFPLQNEHPGYASCQQTNCFYDFDENGVVGATDLMTFLLNYGVLCVY